VFVCVCCTEFDSPTTLGFHPYFRPRYHCFHHYQRHHHRRSSLPFYTCPTITVPVIRCPTNVTFVFSQRPCNTFGDYNISSLTWVSGKTGLKCFNFISSTTAQSLIEGFSLSNCIQFNNLVNSSDNILDLIFTNIQDTVIDHFIDPLVPIDPYHPVLQINYKPPTFAPNSNNDINIFSYNSGDYKNANLFFNYYFNWFNSFNNIDVEAPAYLFQDTLLIALTSFVH